MKMGKYVLVTAARNEAAYIEKTIQSVLAQTRMPEKWVIVSDASTDGTDEIVGTYAKKNRFLEGIRLSRDGRRDRDFSAKVHAIERGRERLKEIDYGYIGILDADVTLPKDYYEKIIDEFQTTPDLGLAGGFIYEPKGGEFLSRRFNTRESVAGSIQVFHRKCYDSIGGLVPSVHGGEDTIAAIMARMKGWKVEAYPHLIVHHHKPTNGVKMMLRGYFRMGMMDYSMGFHPVAEVAKCLYRIAGKPFFFGAATQFCGFFTACLSAAKRPVSDEVVRFVRKEHAGRLKSFLTSRASQSGTN